MFCRNCGKKLEDGWKVCPDCGTKVMADGEQSAGQEMRTASDRKKKKGILPGILFFAGAVVVVFILVSFLSDSRKETKETARFTGSEGVNTAALSGNDLEELLSCSPGELEEYGFVQSDAVEDMFKAPDNSAMVVYEDGNPDMVSIESGGQYCFHGIKTGMDIEEAIEIARDSYFVKYQDEYYVYFMSNAGDAMITAEYGTENGSISKITVSFNEELNAQQLDMLEEEMETEPEETQSPETEYTVRETPTVSMEDKRWFLVYNLFEKEDGTGILAIQGMTDALMNVYFSAGGDYTEWGFGLEPAEIGSEGELIYYYGKDFKMSYYPDDHHILIDSSDEEYAGYYSYIVDFNGGWSDSTSQRCYMEISCQNDIYYEVIINWSSSAADNTCWKFLAEYDKEQGCLVYQDGVRTEQHYPDDGSGLQETVVYTDGEGRIYPKDGKLYWEDRTEGAGDNCVFERE